MQIVTVVGARPQFIKAATVSRQLNSFPEIEEIIVHTGQHYDENMSDIFFEELEMPVVDFHLGIGSGTQGWQTGRMLEAIEEVLLDLRPDWTLVYGDTNSTLAAALAAAKLNIPIAHVEAGLRSFNRKMPEEVNRVLADHLSTLLFAPTQTAVDNLLKEGIGKDNVHQVGDVMYDSTLYYGHKAERQPSSLNTWGLKAKQYVLATIHRPENTDNWPRLDAILRGLDRLASEIAVVLPLHPRTRAALVPKGSTEKIAPSLHFSEPLGYLDMLYLEKNASLIVTDSGGVQKEAFWFRVPCLTLRDQTEWVESVELGWNRVAPPRSAEQVYDASREAMGSQGKPGNPYGEGNAALKIVRALEETTAS